MAKLPPLSMPSSSQSLSKLIILRNVAITLVSLTLAAVWIALGPRGEFLDGRAFTVSTLNQVTYIFYNWTISLPLDTRSQYRFQAWNNRLAGMTTFVPVDTAHGLGDPNKILISVETTAPPDNLFFINPWTGQGLNGFSVSVSGRLSSVISGLADRPIVLTPQWPYVLLVPCSYRAFDPRRSGQN